MFEPDADRRRQVLHAVAEDLRWDEPDMAGLLFALCGHHGKALEEGNTIMSARIRALLDATTSDQERSLAADVQGLALRANDLRTRCGAEIEYSLVWRCTHFAGSIVTVAPCARTRLFLSLALSNMLVNWLWMWTCVSPVFQVSIWKPV